MKHWTNIQAQMPRKNYQRKAPEKARAAGNRPHTLSPEFILRFVAGIMVILGLRLDEHSMLGPLHSRISAYIMNLQRRMDYNKTRKTMIDDWVGGSSISGRLQSRKLWLSSKAINNSPDPNIRRMGHDAWATGRAYPRDPGMGFARLKSTKNYPHPEASRRLGTRRTRIMGVDPSSPAACAAPQGEGIFVLAPP